MSSDLGISKYRHSTTLFTDKNGWPIIYSIRPCDDKARLRPYIEHGGGYLTSKEPPESIRLVPEVSNVYDSDDVCVSYIMDCVKANKLLDLNKYRMSAQNLVVSDISDDEVHSPPSLPKIAHRPVKKVPISRPISKCRKMYRLDEEMRLLKFITSHNCHYDVRGNSVWKDLEQRKLLDRTWQSMREHFLKKMLPNISSYRISERDLRKFKQKSSPRKITSYTKPTLVNNDDENDGMGRLQLESGSIASSKSKFTLEDDCKILAYVISKSARVRQVCGTSMWKDMEDRLSLNRTWQSLKERFHKRILPNISSYDLCREFPRNLKILKAIKPTLFDCMLKNSRVNGDDDASISSRSSRNKHTSRVHMPKRNVRKSPEATFNQAKSNSSSSGASTYLSPQRNRKRAIIDSSDDEQNIVELESVPSSSDQDTPNIVTLNTQPLSREHSSNHKSSERPCTPNSKSSRQNDLPPPLKILNSPSLVPSTERIKSWLHDNDFAQESDESEFLLDDRSTPVSTSSCSINIPVATVPPITRKAVEKRTAESDCIVDKSFSPSVSLQCNSKRQRTGASAKKNSTSDNLSLVNNNEKTAEDVRENAPSNVERNAKKYSSPLKRALFHSETQRLSENVDMQDNSSQKAGPSKSDCVVDKSFSPSISLQYNTKQQRITASDKENSDLLVNNNETKDVRENVSSNVECSPRKCSTPSKRALFHSETQALSENVVKMQNNSIQIAGPSNTQAADEDTQELYNKILREHPSQADLVMGYIEDDNDDDSDDDSQYSNCCARCLEDLEWGYRVLRNERQLEQKLEVKFKKEPRCEDQLQDENVTHESLLQIGEVFSMAPDKHHQNVTTPTKGNYVCQEPHVCPSSSTSIQKYLWNSTTASRATDHTDIEDSSEERVIILATPNEQAEGSNEDQLSSPIEDADDENVEKVSCADTEMYIGDNEDDELFEANEVPAVPACSGCSPTVDYAQDDATVQHLVKFLGTTSEKLGIVLHACKGNVRDLMKMIFDDS